MQYIHKTNSRSRSVTVRLDEQGQVVLTTPPRFPIWRLQSLLDSSQAWITKERKLLESRKKRLLGEDHHNKLLFQGESYEVVSVENHASQMSVVVDNQHRKIHIHPVENTPTSVKKALERWLKAEAEKKLVKLVYATAKTMKIQFQDISFKNQKTRWGSCSTKRNINLNWRLIQAPDPVATYVIIHELAHIQEMNHSRSFWKLVERFDPEYSMHRAWLRRHGRLLQAELWT